MRVPSPGTGRRDAALYGTLTAAFALWSCSSPSTGNPNQSIGDAAISAADSMSGDDAAADTSTGTEAATPVAEAGGNVPEAGGGGDSAADSSGQTTNMDAGSEAAASVTLVPPVQRGNTYVLEFGKTTFVVDPNGARVSGFTLDGTNILTGPSVHPVYWGSTFWTAPEGDWKPPNVVVPIDSAPYTMTVGADSSITGVSGLATVAGKQLVVTKHFTADLTKGAVVIDYSMTNKGTAAVQLGHWEVTRVGPGGLTFYPAAAVAPMSYGPPNQLQKVGAYLWFDHAAFPMGTAWKSFGYAMASATVSWVAHVTPDPAGDIVLIKVIPDIAQGTAGPGAGQIQIFASADRKYVEVEDNNQLLMIAPAQTVPWQVRWYLRRLPAGMMRTVGNQALVDFVLKQIQ